MDEKRRLEIRIEVWTDIDYHPLAELAPLIATSGLDEQLDRRGFVVDSVTFRDIGERHDEGNFRCWVAQPHGPHRCVMFDAEGRNPSEKFCIGSAP